MVTATVVQVCGDRPELDGRSGSGAAASAMPASVGGDHVIGSVWTTSGGVLSARLIASLASELAPVISASEHAMADTLRTPRLWHGRASTARPHADRGKWPHVGRRDPTDRADRRGIRLLRCSSQAHRGGIVMNDHTDAKADSEQAAGSHEAEPAVSPGRRTLSERLPVQRRAQPPGDQASAPSAGEAAVAPAMGDDPFALHLDRAAASTGEPLPAPLESKFGASLGADLGGADPRG